MSLFLEQIIAKFEKHANPENLVGMAKFGITPDHAYGVSLPVIRDLAKEIGKNHLLAQELWNTNIREPRILACMIADPNKVTEELLEKWVRDFDYWEICDQCIMNLFVKTKFAYTKSLEWVRRDDEYIRRSGFVLMAILSYRDKKTDDSKFLSFLPICKKYSTDQRNIVKKAISWSLRRIGARNLFLNKEVLKLTDELMMIESSSAKWIAKDVAKDISRQLVQKKLL
ncbi:MAG TPA: DNA alkylation repair protein [candidate division Zixibacteria bacterium]|nr:DNA alkylation repair protein [candidate division Zixibacteria bacterium]